MNTIKRYALGTAFALAVVFIVWALLFGLSAPCDAVRSELEVHLRSETAETRRAVLQSSRDWNPVSCAGIAMRLRLGDRSAFVVR
jgi:hypothetical protein